MSLKTKNLLRCAVFVLIGAIFIETAHAANPFGDILGGIGNDIASVSGFLISVGTVLSFVFFILLNTFLNPTIIFDLDNTGALMAALNNIWQLSRDVMNIIFAFVLAGVAVYIVITAKKEFIKEYLGKFVLAVILVNFSWFFPRVILDVAHVLAATIYDIPLMLVGSNPTFCVNGTPIAYQGITNVAFFVERCTPGGPVPCFNAPPPPLVGPPAPPQITAGWECIGGSLVCFQKQTINFNTVAGHASILNGLIVNHAALQQMSNVPNIFAGVTPFDEQLAFLVKTGLQVFLVFALLFPLAAMTVAMFIRIPILWLTIAFMPFVFLAFIGGDKLQQFIGDKGPKAIWETFLKFAFLPAIVAIPLAVGFILLHAGSQISCAGGAGNPIGAALSAMRINLPMASNLFDLMWLLMAHLILWIGVFSVLKGTPIVGSISEKIAQTGKTIGRLAWKIPATAAVIPGTSVTPYQAMRALSPAGLEQAISSSGNLGKALEEIGKRASGTATTPPTAPEVQRTASHIGGLSDAERKPLTDAIQAASAATGATATQIKALVDRLKAMPGGGSVTQDNLVQTLRELRTQNPAVAGRLNLTDNTIKQLSDNISQVSSGGTSSGGTPPATPPAPPPAPPSP